MKAPLYHKIQSVFKRDPDNNFKTFLFGQFSLPEFEYLYDNTWAATEKVDGTNMRIHINSVEPSVIGGRTENAQIHKDLMTHMEEIATRAEALGVASDLTLYGEGYGAGIQKGGGDYRPDKAFILFDVMVTETGLFLSQDDVKDIAEKLELPVAPMVAVDTLRAFVDSLSTFAEPPVSSLKDGIMEGYVLRPLTELRTRRGERVITKLKVSDFPN